MKPFLGRLFNAGAISFLHFLEACILLSAATLAVRLLPFKSYTPFLGEQVNGKDLSSLALPEFDIQRLRPCINAIRRGSRYLPFECKCLVQALAARGMLWMRGIPSTAYFGVARDEKGALKAHAWVKVGDVFISGAGGVREYTEITVFQSGSPSDSFCVQR